MKYKIIKSDLWISGQIYPEDSEIELSQEQAVTFKNYLIPIEPVPEPKVQITQTPLTQNLIKPKKQKD